MTAWQSACTASRTDSLRSSTWRGRLTRCLSLSLAGLVGWLLTAPSLHARGVYEWREANGTAAYSQWPPRPGDGTVVRTLELDRPTAAQRAEATREPAPDLPAAPTARRAPAGAGEGVATALAALQRAEHARRTGQAPLPGERQHLVDGHSRLTNAYFDRIHALETAVSDARAALQRASAARNNLAP